MVVGEFAPPHLHLSGLIYQSTRNQYLGLFLGHSSHAHSLVLMLFMGGMAIGAWWSAAVARDDAGR